MSHRFRTLEWHYGLQILNFHYKTTLKFDIGVGLPTTTVKLYSQKLQHNKLVLLSRML